MFLEVYTKSYLVTHSTKYEPQNNPGCWTVCHEPSLLAMIPDVRILGRRVSKGRVLPSWRQSKNGSRTQQMMRRAYSG